MNALGGSGSSRELEDRPAPRDGEGSLDEVDVLYGRFGVRSGICTPSGEIYWNCYGDVK